VTWSACVLPQLTATASNRGTVPKEQPNTVNLLLIYIVVIGGVFVFMTSRSNRKRQSQASMLQAALVVGAQVRTIGGMVGEVIEVDDEHVVVETTPGVRLKFVKSAVAGVITPAEPDELESADAGEADDGDEAENDETAVAEHESAGHEGGTAEPSDEVPAHEPEAGAEDAARHGASEPAKR
jgi:preprotein translocase subunit YajC